jgi:hypothetical protein
MMRVKITRTPLWEWVRGAAELWRCRVPIGETLAEARQRAGLTVAQVSEQTCISTAPAGAMTPGRKATRDIAAAAIMPAERGPVFAWRPADSVVCGGKNATRSPGW